MKEPQSIDIFREIEFFLTRTQRMKWYREAIVAKSTQVEY